jgi:hypothetical protein
MYFNSKVITGKPGLFVTLQCREYLCGGKSREQEAGSREQRAITWRT